MSSVSLKNKGLSFLVTQNQASKVADEEV